MYILHLALKIKSGVRKMGFNRWVLVRARRVAAWDSISSQCDSTIALQNCLCRLYVHPQKSAIPANARGLSMPADHGRKRFVSAVCCYTVYIMETDTDLLSNSKIMWTRSTADSATYASSWTKIRLISNAISSTRSSQDATIRVGFGMQVVKTPTYAVISNFKSQILLKQQRAKSHLQVAKTMIKHATYAYYI